MLADADFIELTRPLMTSDGDEVDLQIAVFDQEMRADIAELGGRSPQPGWNPGLAELCPALAPAATDGSPRFEPHAVEQLLDVRRPQS